MEANYGDLFANILAQVKTACGIIWLVQEYFHRLHQHLLLQELCADRLAGYPSSVATSLGGIQAILPSIGEGMEMLTSSLN